MSTDYWTQGSVEIFNLVALHRQQVSSTTLDTSFAGSLVFAFDTLDLLNTELGSAWAEVGATSLSVTLSVSMSKHTQDSWWLHVGGGMQANRIEEQIRFARLDDVPMTGVDAPRLVDAQENLLFSLRCDETTSTSERSCQFYLSEVCIHFFHWPVALVFAFPPLAVALCGLPYVTTCSRCLNFEPDDCNTRS